MRVDRADLFGALGVGAVAAGLYGIAGWPYAAVFVGMCMLGLSFGLSRRKG